MAKPTEENKAAETRTAQQNPSQHETKQQEAKSTAGRSSEREGSSQEQGRQSPNARSEERGLAPYRRDQSPARTGAWGGPMARWRDEFDNLLEQFSRGWLGIPVPRFEGNWGLDIREDDDKVMVRAEAPGFEPDDFDIKVRGDQLTLRACRKSERERKEGEFHEWRQQEYFQSVTLPSAVDANNVKANYRHGVLSVTLPKSEENKARHIKVEG